MAPKFDPRKTKHQLYHISISLSTVFLCLTYVHNVKSWDTIGTFWESAIIPLVLIGQASKVFLAKYFSNCEKDLCGGYVKKQKKKSNIPALGDVLASIFLHVICTMLYGFLCILLGAPVLKNYEQTFILALLLTFFTVSPTVWMIGMGGALQVIFCEKSDFLTKSEEVALELFKYTAAGVIFGAWAGSVVVPLDWDQEWQNYPIPNIVGGLLGCGLASVWTISKVLFTTGKLYINKKRC